MQQFWKKIWEICLLRAAPQDIPASSALLLIALAVFFVMSFLVALTKLSFSQSLGAATADMVLLLFISYVMMWVKVTMNRWCQMATSMAATTALLGVIALPLAVMQVSLDPEGMLVSFVMLFLLAVMIWNLVIVAHIFKHAVDANIYFAVILAGVYMYISLKIMSVLFFRPE